MAVLNAHWVSAGGAEIRLPPSGSPRCCRGPILFSPADTRTRGCHDSKRGLSEDAEVQTPADPATSALLPDPDGPPQSRDEISGPTQRPPWLRSVGLKCDRFPRVR